MIKAAQTRRRRRAPAKAAAAPGAAQAFAAVRQEALAHEAAGRWLEAAESWTAAEELATKKAERQEAAGCAAAARVRAEAARPVSSGTALGEVAEPEVIREEPPAQNEVETVLIESTPAAEEQPSPAQDAPAEDAPTAPQVAHDAPASDAATIIAPTATAVPTGETGATGDGSPEPPIADAMPATETPAADATPTTETVAADATPATETPVTEAEKPSKRRRAASQQPARERDERLPPVGTVLRKLDRHGNLRCECTIEQDGIRYGGALYQSLTAAAIAACKDLGLKTKTVNGWLFWSLTQPPRTARPKRDALAGLERAFERYLERATSAAQSASFEERAKVQGALQQHASALLQIASKAVPTA